MLKKALDPDKLSDVLLKKAIEARRPLSCTFELTYHCNFRCPMCYIRMTDEQAKPFGRLRTLDEWLDMARQVRDAGVLYLTLTGGECTQYPRFMELYEAVSKMGFRVDIMTNAGAYNDALRDLFRRYPPYSAMITLYGGSNETYEKVTGDPKGLDKVLENIRFFQGIGVPLDLRYTVIRQNVLDYPKIGKIVQEFNVPYCACVDLTAHHYDPSYTEIDKYRLTPAEMVCFSFCKAKEIKAAMVEAKELEKTLSEYVPPKAGGMTKSNKSICNGAFTTVAIYWNGEMNTCVSMSCTKCFKPFEIGFEAAWEQMQNDVKCRFALPQKCKNCSLIDECYFSCPARNAEGSGSAQEVDPRICEFTWLQNRYMRTHKGDSQSPERKCN